MKQSQRIDCLSPPEFHTLRGGMDNYDEEDGLDYGDDDKAYGEDWDAEDEVESYGDESEDAIISLHSNEEEDSKLASVSNTRKKRILRKLVASLLYLCISG